MEVSVDNLKEQIIHFGVNILAALAIFLIGRFIAKIVSRFIEDALIRAQFDKTLAAFGRNLVFYGSMTFVVIASLNKLGVETSSFIAVVGAASLAVGLALQGSLSNFASGVLLIIFHPFKVGDVIEAGGAHGRVEEIQIFNTIIHAQDKRIIIVPNSKITGDKIIIEKVS